MPEKLMPKIMIPVEGMTFEDDGEEVISEIQIAMTGSWFHEWYGQFEISKRHLQEMKRNHREGKRKVCVDYQHSSLSWDPDAAVAAGWVVDDSELKTKEKGAQLWATVSWTPKAVEHIKAREYRFISPEIEFDYTDKEGGEKIGAVLLAIALTNRPFLEGMEEVSLSEPMVAASVRFSEVQPAKQPSKGGNTAMDEKRIREVLGLSEDIEITEEHKVDAFKKLEGRIVNLTAEVVALKAQVRKLTEDQPGRVLLTESDVAKLKADAEAGRTAGVKLAEMQRDKAIDDAIRAGKVIPAEREWALGYALSDPAGFAKMVEARPRLVDLTERGSDGSGPGSDAEKVRQFIAQKVKEGAGIAVAQRMALSEFGAEAFGEYREAKPKEVIL